jgi:uncharacterized membrane protein
VATKEGVPEMTKLFSIKPAITLRGRTFKGLRGWSGKPMHPPLTDVPTAAYVLAAVFDVVSFAMTGGDGRYTGGAERDFFVAATYVMIGGFVVSLGAALTGFWDWWKGIDRDPSTGWLGRAKHTQAWRTINWHATLMLTTTAIALVDILVRLAQFDTGRTGIVVLVLSVLAAALVSVGATYGGSLVYDYQFNVEDLSGSTVWDETEVDQMPGDKAHPG